MNYILIKYTFMVADLQQYMQVGRSAVVVVRVPGYRSRGPGSIPHVARFSEK
jgi:hypothetical protein